MSHYSKDVLFILRNVPFCPPDVFKETGAEAALAAGIFHREEMPINAVEEHLRSKGIETR